MRKRALVVLILGWCFSLMGCSNVVSQSEYDAVCVERDALQEERDALQEERDSLRAQVEELSSVSTEQEEGKKVLISGSFPATVRDLIPDYSLNETTLNVAVISLFQCGPFTVYVGEEMAAELQVGETYVFEIVEMEVEKVTNSTDPQTVIPLYHLRIKSARIAEESERGLGGPDIIYTEIE